MQSTMQNRQLGIAPLLRHVHGVTSRSRVITQTATTPRRTTFAEIAERAGRLGTALKRLGFGNDTVVGTFLGATQEHLEAYLGIPASGSILHTINLRLHDDQIDYVINHAADKVIIVEGSHAPRLIKIVSSIAAVRLLIVVGDAPGLVHGRCSVMSYEEVLGHGDPVIDWPDADERQAAVICYTGGTTGLPKGVVYSHRSLWLHAMTLCTANTLSVSAQTRVLPAVPLYHVNGWGLPFAAFMAGADLVLPGHSLKAKDLLKLIDEECPTLAAGVPTIWSDVLQLLRALGRNDLGTVKTISCGGAQVPESMSDSYAAIGVTVTQAWGMTETSSMSAIATIPSWAANDQDRKQYATTQGRIVCGLEVRVADLEGNLFPSDGATVGEIQIRGPWVTGSYLGSTDTSSFQDGWLRTGDLGTVDKDGYIRLSDRVKDAIKSGGEWIPSLALEEAIRAHPAVAEVAVVAIADERWQERPAAFVVLKKGQDVDGSALSRWLDDRVARWWIPSHWTFVQSIPLTTVGKIDKKAIRQYLTDCNPCLGAGR